MKKIIIQISRAFVEVIEEGKSLDKVSFSYLKNLSDSNDKDKGFFAETLIESVRWWRLLKTCTVSNSQGIGHYIDLVKTYLLIKKNWSSDDLEITSTQKRIIFENLKSVENKREIRESIPDWLDSICYQELGSIWDQQLSGLNTLPKICLRVNTLKIAKEKLRDILIRENYNILEDDYQDGIVLSTRANIFKSDAFREGLFEVQDISSQQVAHFLNVEKGMRVIDACAGLGGKTLHLATIMNNKGKIIAMDTDEWKLAELGKRSNRAGVSIIESRTIKNNKVIKRLANSADRLLLDVPCSGLGVLRRNPDAKWRLTKEKIDDLRKTQADILKMYTRMLKPGGKVVYSTCSILPSENSEQVRSFISSSEGSFELEEEKTILPYESGFDGFYMARMVRIR